MNTVPDSDMSTLLESGEYRPPSSSDLLSPCPLVNALANHGYIPRDGRNVTMDDFKRCLTEILHMTPLFAASFYIPPFMIHTEDLPETPSDTSKSILPHNGAVAPPTSTLFHGVPNIPGFNLDHQLSFGCRNPNQVNALDIPVLNLDQLRRHGAIEHDVSLIRRDHAQGDNWSIQPDLLSTLLNINTSTTTPSTSTPTTHASKTVNVADLAHFRNMRLKQQIRDNPGCKFGLKEKFLAFGEVALLLTILGGQACGHGEIQRDRLAALMGEERLPYREGWVSSRKSPLGWAEVEASSLWAQMNALMEHRQD